jgi:hypothetical protein
VAIYVYINAFSFYFKFGSNRAQPSGLHRGRSKIVGDIGEDLLSLLNSSQTLLTEPTLTTHINEVTATLQDIILVLDGYHIIEVQLIDSALTLRRSNINSNGC